MGALVLALWALLVSLDPAGGVREPGNNLSCYQCFKVRSPEFCLPTACSSTDQVCVSHKLIITLRLRVKTLLSKRCAPRCPNTNMEFKWLSDSRELSKIVRQCCSRSLCNGAPAPQEGPWALSRGLLLQADSSPLSHQGRPLMRREGNQLEPFSTPSMTAATICFPLLDDLRR
ncbi:lymphocyte antigen 6L [Dama dama]|uniref:lymphocyte antigen 6L n=1 Tax=Dama dama TaxID=30532 RepID=UPI002A36EDA8|nr:lymphocyte antigen 6L [Dama dama]